MTISDIFFPKRCLGCRKNAKYICETCLDNLGNIRQSCPYCERASVDGATHVFCAGKLKLDGCFSIWPYQKVIKEAILKMKYSFALQVATEISEYMVFKLKELPIFPKNSLLVPIPMFWLRENFRGFNQSEVIGEYLAKNLGWDFNPLVLIRKKLRKPQTALKAKERKENVRGVFAFNKAFQHEILKYQLLILFDDVYTTGSTLKEAAKVLKRNTLVKVWGLTIAR